MTVRIPTAEQINAWQLIDDTQGPGYAIGIIHRGELVLTHAQGYASLEHRVPIDALHTVFDIGSTSKQFTAACTLLLVQQGKLRLEDPITRVLPKLPDYCRGITIHHLLHHTSGLRDYIMLMTLADIREDDYTSESQAFEFIRRQSALDFAPGTEYSYSNSNYFLLSLTVKQVSGESLASFAQQRLFSPLGMQQSQYLETHQQVIANRASAYYPLPEAGYGAIRSHWCQTGDGAVQTTIADLAKWDRNFYSGQVGGTWLREQMLKTGELSNRQHIDYARGLLVESYQGLALISHAGSWSGFSADLWRFPEQEFSVIALSNRADLKANELAQTMADWCLQLEPSASVAYSTTTEIALAPLTETMAKSMTGSYWNRKEGLLRRLVWHEGKLWYVRDFDQAEPLQLLASGRLRPVEHDNPIELEVIGAGSNKRRLRWHDGKGDTVDFEMVEAVDTDHSNLSAFIGHYYSVDLNIEWQLQYHQQGLVKHSVREPAQPLIPAFRDAFAGIGMLLHFQRDVSGQVTGFSIDAGRARGIQFCKR